MQTSVSFINDDSNWLDKHFADGWRYVAMVSAGSGAGAGASSSSGKLEYGLNAEYEYSHQVVTTVILEMDDDEYKRKGYPERFAELENLY